MIMNIKQTTSYLVLLLSLVASQLHAEEVGKVQYTRGAVTMQNMDGSSARLIAKDESVQRGEVLTTGPRSFTIVKLSDGTRMTIRPNSSFSVEEFNPKEDSTASALLRLFRGGMRAITGYISKRNPNGYKVNTGVATLGIRGTEFDARLCKEDCAQENDKHKQNHDKIIDRTVARAVFVRKGLKARSIDGVNRNLKPGSAIFEGDTLYTRANGYAILVFKDKSRVSLQANTVFRVDEMKFKEDEAKDSTALFSLLRGGLRTITGLIGKLNPRKYSMRTSLATIGIRGTGYDLMLSGFCDAPDVEGGTSCDEVTDDDGLYAYVWDGSISIGEQVVPKGKAAYQADENATPVMLPAVPDFFKNNAVPKPDSFDVDETKLFSTIDTEEAPPGLYVTVTGGHVSVENKSGIKLELKAGMSGFTDVLGRQANHLASAPVFQRFDAYPLPDVPNPAIININTSTIGGEESGMVCEIQ